MSGPLTRLFPLTLLARRNLSRARVRTALAVLGIAIGVIAVAGLGVFGLAFYDAQTGSFQDSARSVIVLPGEDADFHRLDERQVARIEAAAPEESELFLLKQRQLAATYDGDTERATVKAVKNPGDHLTAERGKIPESWRTGVLVGSSYADRRDIAVGESIEIDGDSYQVRAVLQGNRGSLFRPNEALFVPPSRLESGHEMAMVRTTSAEAAFATSEEMSNRLNPLQERRYEIQDLESAAQRLQEQKGRINSFLIGVGAISLLVAGVSILNIMLMSVVERREEIGVFRAVGYQRFDIVRLILGEAVLLGVVGAIVGAAGALGVGMIINQFWFNDPLAFADGSLRYLALGVGFGVVVSAISGAYPAWRAANARPVEALRD